MMILEVTGFVPEKDKRNGIESLLFLTLK